MKRCIYHIDMNGFYASVECLHRPEIRDKPVVVGGDVENRHGIVLAKNELAKPYGIKTGEVIWQAMQKCPHLVSVPPNFSLYLRYSKMFREMLATYSDCVEPFGLDECWVSMTDSLHLFGGDGEALAHVIRERIKTELGITVSIGVSFNKIFAKLGSDMKKPDAVTVITEDDFREKVWPLPVEDLLYVGSATKRKLNAIGIETIGGLARTDPELLLSRLGKWAYVLHSFANGRDNDPVSPAIGKQRIIKSIGNSTTTPRDLTCYEDVSLTMYVLAESVAMRLKEHGFIGRTVQISLRGTDLFWFERQAKLATHTALSGEIHDKAMELVRGNCDFAKPLRSVGVRVTDLIPADSPMQLSLWDDQERRRKIDELETTVFGLRDRFGYDCIKRAVMCKDKIGKINPRQDHTIHPVSYFR